MRPGGGGWSPRLGTMKTSSAASSASSTRSTCVQRSGKMALAFGDSPRPSPPAPQYPDTFAFALPVVSITIPQSSPQATENHPIHVGVPKTFHHILVHFCDFSWIFGLLAFVCNGRGGFANGRQEAIRPGDHSALRSPCWVHRHTTGGEGGRAASCRVTNYGHKKNRPGGPGPGRGAGGQHGPEPACCRQHDEHGDEEGPRAA